MINVVALSGRLVADPDVKKVGQKGVAMCRFRVAVETRYLKGVQWESEKNYPPCIIWGKPAEYLGEYGKKGVWVALSGRFKTGSYERDGKTIYTNEVLVAEMDIQGVVAAKPKQTHPELPDDGVPF